MDYRKIGTLFLAVIAACAVAASSASAGNFEESGSAAYIGPSPGTKLTGSKVLKTEVIPESVMQMTTTVGSKNTPIKTEATGYSCLECKIENSGTNAVGKGKLEATGVHMVEPAGCKDGPTIFSEPVKAVLGMKKGSSTIATVKFEPASGTLFEEAEIEGCAIAGTYPVKGSVIAEVVNFTGVFAKTQRLKFSQAIQTDAGGSLSFGGHAAFVTAEAQGSLEGGVEWAAKEK